MMESDTLELEGTWEEILARSEDLAGRRVHLTVLSPKPTADHHPETLPHPNQKMLEVLQEWKNTPLTDEEIQILEDFEQFRKDHPIRFRTPEDRD